MISLPLESELQVIRLKLYLERNPEEAMEMALQHYEDFLALAAKYKKLQSKLDDIETCMLNFKRNLWTLAYIIDIKVSGIVSHVKQCQEIKLVSFC